MSEAAVTREHPDVLWLQIPMNEPSLVRLPQRIQELPKNVDRVSDGKHAAFAKDIGEVNAVHPLEHQVSQLAVRAGVEQFDRSGSQTRRRCPGVSPWNRRYSHSLCAIAIRAAGF